MCTLEWSGHALSWPKGMLQCSRIHGGCTLMLERVHVAQKKYIFHTVNSRQNAAMQQIFTTCSPRVCQHGNPGTGHSAGGEHWTMHCTHHDSRLRDNMKEHLNRTACGSFYSNCSTPSRQQHCSRWPHYVLLSFSTVSWWTIKENIFQPEECKSLAAALQGGFLWNTACWAATAGRSAALACACQPPQGFIGA